MSKLTDSKFWIIMIICNAIAITYLIAFSTFNFWGYLFGIFVALGMIHLFDRFQ